LSDFLTLIAAQQRHCAVSAVPFWPAHPWSHVVHTPKAAARWLPILVSAASAMAVFDAWIGNADRINGTNLVLSEGLPDGASGFAYLDFTRAMTFNWRDGPPWEKVHLDVHFPGALPIEKEVVRQTLQDIFNLPETTIGAILRGVPAAFLSASRSACILDGLVKRRPSLSEMVEKRHGVT
jgi:hypothetical protein